MKNIIWIILIVILLALVGIVAYRYGSSRNQNVACTEEAKVCPDGSTVGRGGPNCEFANCPSENGDSTAGAKMTEADARKIAERFCIKGGEALGAGMYNENSRTWWFDANLNSTQPGCNPACVVSEETGMAEINWRCTGLIAPEATAETIQRLFEEKYSDNAGNTSVYVDVEAGDFARGSVSFAEGMGGGLWLAARINGQWQIVHDGNGQIPCSLSSYGFPPDFLSDCS